MPAMRMSIGSRLGAGYGLVVVLMLALTGFSISQINGLSANLTTINDINSVKQRHAINFRGSVHDRAIAIRDVAMLPAAERPAVIAEIETLADDYARNETALTAMMATSGGGSVQERAMLARIAAVQARTNPLVDRIIEHQQAEDTAAVTAMMAEVRPLFVEWLAAINAFIDYHEAANQSIGTDVRATAEGFGTLALSAVALASLLALIIAVLVTRSITRPVRDLSGTMGDMAKGNYDVTVPHTRRPDQIGAMAATVEVFRTALLDSREEQRQQMAAQEATTRKAQEEARRQTRVVSDVSAGLERLAAGDLTQPIASPADDPFPAEYDLLRQSYNGLLDRLQDIVAQISAVASDVNEGAKEIDRAANNLSTRAETQAATLEQSSAAINLLLSSVRSTSQKAGQGEDAGRSNREQAQSGAQVVSQAIEAMKAIERGSEQMTLIISVIDDIAFQTNLLALNAGVEAARAGDAGRGFAVVASEVRALAQRASESAREIKTLISESSAQVEAGSTLVGQTDARLSEILLRARDVQDLMVDIAAATGEQTASLEEISNGVAQLDQVTQQNAAVAEETTAAALTLSQRAAELTGVLGYFHLSPRKAGPDTAPRAARAPANAAGEPVRRIGAA